MTVPKLEDLLVVIEKHLILSREELRGDVLALRLEQAITYALSSGGKRLRPLMVLASAFACARDASSMSVIANAIGPACAVEYVHTYSLIHDDLPCMDDDDYRRGRLSVHRRFDEAIAVLAGDALLADAFVLCSSAKSNGALLARELAITAGSSGLVAGQALDLASDHTTTFAEWQRINSAKTARLFQACAVMGGLAVDATKAELLALAHFGHHFGVAFQIKDDIDDKTGVACFGNGRDIEALRVHLGEAERAFASLRYHETLSRLLHLTFATCV